MHQNDASPDSAGQTAAAHAESCPDNETATFPAGRPNAQIQSLRKQAFTSAWSIAKRYNFHENASNKRKTIARIEHWGIGYFIVEFPAKAAKARKTDLALRDSLWWLLFEFCDMPWALQASRPLVAKIVNRGALFDYIRTGDGNVLRRIAKNHLVCSIPMIGLFNMCARQLDEQTWTEVGSLINAYRALHRLATEQNIHLFQQTNIGGKSKI